MAKIRSIKPDFWEDEDLAKLSLPCRLFYIGMWTFADDFGIIKANPALLKSKILPYDSTRVDDIKKWLDALANARMIIPFEYKDEGYFIIRTFRTHQKIDKRWEASILPDDFRDKAVGLCDNMHKETPAPPEDPPAPEQTPPQEEPEEPEITQEEKDFHAFEKWILRNAPRVAQMEKPFTLEEYLRLREDFTPKYVNDMLKSMHNYKDLLKKNIDANLTFRNWARRDNDGKKDATGQVSGGTSKTGRKDTGVSTAYQEDILKRLGITPGSEEVPES